MYPNYRPEAEQSLIEYKRLGTNSDFYNNVFKKTERIVAAVFYILSHIPVTEKTRLHHERVSQKAMTLLDVAADALDLYEHAAAAGVHEVQRSVVVLESALAVMQGAGLLSRDVVAAVADECDLVLRYLRHHYTEGGIAAGTATTLRPNLPTAPRRPSAPRRSRPQIPTNDMSSDAILVYSNLTDRTTRIKTVLEAKPQATIKDLTDIITDVSAKTIQRDLNSLIESGEVIREGERRWSTYSLKIVS